MLKRLANCSILTRASDSSAPYMHNMPHTRKKNTKPKGRPFASANQDTRKTLLDAAVTLFARQGVPATSLAQIAKEVDLTPAMIHYYFNTRDQLLDAVVQERVLPLIELLWNDELWQQSDPVALFTTFVDNMVDACLEMPWLPDIWMKEFVTEGGVLRHRFFKHIPRNNVSRIISIFTEGQKNGLFNPDINPNAFMSLVLCNVMVPFCISRNHANSQQIFDFSFPIDVDVDALRIHCKAILLHGMMGKCPKAADAS